MPIHRSPFPAPEIPAISITELVLRGVEPRGDAPVLINGITGEATSGRDFADQVRRLAGGLKARGFGPGKVIAVMLPNMPEFAILFHATAFCGATLTPINPTYTPRELRQQLQDSRAELLITIAALFDLARDGASGTGVKDIAVIGAAPGAIAYADLFGLPLQHQVPVDLSGRAAVLPFSSGTTGFAKGVMLSHRNLVANVMQLRSILPVMPGEVTLAVLPFFHIYGMQVLLNHYLASGGAVVTLPRFDLEAALRLMQDCRTRRFLAAPPIVLALAKNPLVDQFDLSALEEILSGAAPLGAELQVACEARLGCQVLGGYGLTEASPVVAIVPKGTHRPGATGVALAGTEMRVADPATGLDYPDDVEGELLVRGPQVMLGYLGHPDATAATLLADGWLRTGDLCRIDASGYLYIVDRVKELIKVKGFQVAPAELEALIVAHSEIADAAVVGMPDEEAGERPVAFVVRRMGSEVHSQTIKDHVAGQVAPYKQLAEVRFVDAIPKSPSGKILRRLLKATL